MDTGMLLIKALVLGMVFTAVLGFFFIRYMSRSTEGAVNRLNKETEEVRKKQTELNAKIKEASEELTKRRSEADALVNKMKEDAETKAREERDKIIKKAREDSEEIISKAQKTKEDMRKELEKQAAMKVIDYTVVINNDILNAKTLTAFHESLVSEFLNDLEKVDMEMIGEDVKTAELVTAITLTDALKNRLSDVLKKKLDRTVTFDIKEDKKLICGIVIKFGSLALNGSLEYLLRNKATEIKEKIERGLM